MDQQTRNYSTTASGSRINCTQHCFAVVLCFWFVLFVFCFCLWLFFFWYPFCQTFFTVVSSPATGALAAVASRGVGAGSSILTWVWSAFIHVWDAKEMPSNILIAISWHNVAQFTPETYSCILIMSDNSAVNYSLSKTIGISAWTKFLQMVTCKWTVHPSSSYQKSYVIFTPFQG